MPFRWASTLVELATWYVLMKPSALLTVMEVALTPVTEPRWVSTVWNPPPDLGTTNWPCTAPNGPPKPMPKPPGRPRWGKSGRADGEGVATVPPAGDTAAVPDSGEPDVAAIATPAPAS